MRITAARENAASLEVGTMPDPNSGAARFDPGPDSHALLPCCAKRAAVATGSGDLFFRKASPPSSAVLDSAVWLRHEEA
jgi:hypothetical protein